MKQPDSVAPVMPIAVQEIVATLSAQPEVTAIALGGSRCTGFADAESDYDIYVFVESEISIPLSVRRQLAERFDSAPEINNTWWGPGDEWEDHATGTAVDIIYWEAQPFARQIRDVIEGHRPSLGYSTSFWFTVAHATPLFDRNGWFADVQSLAATPYPGELRRAIVRFNYPLLRSTRSSYRHQIELASMRNDPVVVQHRATELLASVFDIVFAVNRTLHPGEKRQLAHLASIDDANLFSCCERVRNLIRSTTHPDPTAVVQNVDALCDLLDSMIDTADLSSAISG